MADAVLMVESAVMLTAALAPVTFVSLNGPKTMLWGIDSGRKWDRSQAGYGDTVSGLVTVAGWDWSMSLPTVWSARVAGS